MSGRDIRSCLCSAAGLSLYCANEPNCKRNFGELAAKFCSSCGSALGPNARFCSSCGVAVTAANPRIYPTQPAPSQLAKPRRRWLKWGGIGCGGLLGGIIIIIILGAIFSEGSNDVEDTSDQQEIQTPTQTFEQIKSTARTIDYREFFRNSDRYKSQIFYFSGTVVQVIENWGDSFDLRVAVGLFLGIFLGDEVVYLKDYEGERLLEGDEIEFVGQADGLERYNAIMGNQVTIPRLKALKVRRR